MSPPSSWRRHDVEPLGISVELLAAPPVERWQRADGGGVWQSIAGPNDGLFVRWGESASLAAFRESLGDLLTRPVELVERPLKVAGMTACRVSATVERGVSVAYVRDAEGTLSHRETPAARHRIEAVSLVHDGLHGLVGCRLAAASWPAHAATVRHFLGSVRALGG